MPRLVDADALKTELMLAAETLTVAYEAHGEGYVAHSEDIITCNKMNELLRSFPTADAVPVRHGKWIESQLLPKGRGRLFICSECNKGWAKQDRSMDGINYCPNCGAKMDQE